MRVVRRVGGRKSGRVGGCESGREGGREKKRKGGRVLEEWEEERRATTHSKVGG